MTDLPPAPPEEEKRNACCDVCGSLWHATPGHDSAVAAVSFSAAAVNGWPEGYDPAEADKLIGRKPAK